MKKIISQISLILLIISIGMASVFITKANADSIAGLNCPSSVAVGKDFTVALILPSNAESAQANITVKFSDGTTSSKSLVYMKGMDGFPNSITFNASKEGKATVSATNIVISDANANELESNGSKSAAIDIQGNQTTTTTPTTTTTTTNNGSTTSSDTSSGSTSNQVKFTDVNETVYISETCNVRKSYSTDSEKITKLQKGTSLKRTGIGNNGWSRVEYNGSTAYIYTQYLTTTEVKVEFKDVEETMYATQNCNLRKSWSTSSDKAGYLTEGQEVTRTGIADNGWSRINYNGQVVYVASRLLTDKLPEEDVNEVEDENIVEEVTEDVELTEEEILAGIKEEIGVLPEVGNNIATTIYTIITLISIAIISVGIYYIKKI